MQYEAYANLEIGENLLEVLFGLGNAKCNQQQGKALVPTTRFKIKNATLKDLKLDRGLACLPAGREPYYYTSKLRC